MTYEDADITGLLQSMHAGHEDARSELIQVLYRDLYERAENCMRRQPQDHTLQATALVSEAFLRLVGTRNEPWANRSHFLAVAATAMRQVLMDHARSKGCAKRKASGSRVPLDKILVEFEERACDLEALNHALVELAEFDPDMARGVELRFFGGMTALEASQHLGMSVRTFERKWRATKAWLLSRIQKTAPSESPDLDRLLIRRSGVNPHE